LVALLVAFAAAPVAGQTSVRLEQEARFTKLPGAQTLGTLLPGAEVTPGRLQRSAVEIAIEGWLPSAALAARRRDSFDVQTTKRPNAEFRNAPDGATIARVSPNVGFIKLETRGDWIRVRRTAWMDQKFLPAAPAAPTVPTGPDRVEVIRKAGLAVAPEAAVVGTIDSGAGAKVLSRSGGWTKVQLEMWVPDSALRSTDNRILVGVSQAEVRANPARYLGQLVEWRLQFVAVQKADELRPEIPAGQSYLLTRGPLPEPGFVYVVVPSNLVSQFQAVPSLKEIVIRGTIRAASTKYLPTPVLDLVEVVEGPGNQEHPQ
jgi:hypothetical protein